MKLNNETAKLVAELEYLIGKECYNPNSYDTYYDCYGKQYRYPITFPKNEQEDYVKTRYSLNDTSFITEITEDVIKKMHYKIGSNQLYIGRGIIQILEYLEEYYNIDFDEICKK